MTTTEICNELQALQRQRSRIIKSRISLENNRRANVAVAMGYTTGLEEDSRKKMFDEADKLINRILSGEESTTFDGLVQGSELGIDAFKQHAKTIEKSTLKLVKKLNLVKWVEAPEQRGFGLPMLAIVLGETGDLSNYSGPAKLWKRLGCAPFTKGGETWMGSTWRSRPKGINGQKFSADDWEAAGYSPRRRSIAYLIGEGLVKQNADGPYRKRYDEAKAALAKAHPDPTGEKEYHPDYPPLRCHRHGMLLATKLLLKNLWRNWHGLANCNS